MFMQPMCFTLKCSELNTQEGEAEDEEKKNLTQVTSILVRVNHAVIRIQSSILI